ncbi:MAG: PGN_0703 family putative restriction endonuclease [Bacillota bacterium]
MNQALRALYDQHLDALIALLARHKETSYPHLIQVPAPYLAAPRKVVIVGQQTYGWEADGMPPRERVAEVKPTLIDVQQKLYSDFFPAGIPARSPFWRAFQQVQAALAPGPIDSCLWAELVKVDHEGQRPPEAVDADWFEHFNVLAAELRILEPDVVIFFTGPYYDQRIVESFPGARLEPVLESKGAIVRIIHPDLPLHTYRTYHPAYLNRTNWQVVDDLIALCQDGSNPLQIRSSEALVVQNRAKQALADALRDYVGPAAMDPAQAGYAARLQGNILPTIAEVQYLGDFAGAAGHELDSKMRAAYSSSALAVNSFAPWKGQAGHLSLGVHRGFESIRFEAVCRTGLRGTAPHLDLLADGPEGLVGVEVKCTEYLQPHPLDFSESYDKLFDQYPALRRVKEEWGFTYLNASQLVKHAFGLINEADGRPVTLLYLFWEPVNWAEFRIFTEHRREVRRFASLIQGAPIRFEAMTFDQLWTTWALQAGPEWVPAHLEALRARYTVTL